MTASVVKLKPRKPAEPPLAERFNRLEVEHKVLMTAVLKLFEHEDARTPKVPPDNWVTPKDAGFETGYTPPSLYRMIREGKIEVDAVMKIGGRIAIDRNKLPKRKPPIT